MLTSIQYGAGEIIVKDSVGNSHVLGLLQSNSFDLTTTTKGIRGSGLYEEMVAVMGQEVSIKAANAHCLSGLEALASGGTITTGSKWPQTDSKTCAASVVCTPPNSGTFSLDLGVIDSNGQPFKFNSGTLAAGEYNQTAGTYAFHATDAAAGHTIQIRYLYTLTTGETVTVTNTAVGLLAGVGVRVYNFSKDAAGVTRKIGRYVPAASISKFSVSNKTQDFMTVDLEFKAYGALGTTVYEAYYA